MKHTKRSQGLKAAVCELSLCSFAQSSSSLSSAGSYKEGTQRFQEQRDGSARIKSPFNQVQTTSLHDWYHFKCSQKYWHARDDFFLKLQNLSFFLYIYIFLGFTDHSRPPLSRAVPNRRSPPLRTLSAGQQNGARFYNKAMSSEMPFQVPHNWVGTTPQDADTHYSIHVVAHKDSSRFTLPPPRVEFARLSLKPLCWALRQALSSVAIG